MSKDKDESWIDSKLWSLANRTDTVARVVLFFLIALSIGFTLGFCAASIN